LPHNGRSDGGLVELLGLAGSTEDGDVSARTRWLPDRHRRDAASGPDPAERVDGSAMGDDEPIFEDEAQINTVLGAVMIHYNTLIRDIDRSLERLEVDRIVDYRPLFLSGDQKPTHDAVRAWVRGFWKAMVLAPETWSKLAEDERTRIIIAPFVGFFDLGHLAPHEVPVTSTTGSTRTLP